MKRHKFYTFISLFGISMTLTILIVLASFIDQALAPTYPEVNRSRSLYVRTVKIMDIKNHSSSMNPLSQFFIKTYIKTMPLPEKVAMTTSMAMPTNTYLNQQKAKVFIKYTDDEFWNITQFLFLEGKGFTNETLKSNAQSVIISDLIRDKYFGKGVSVIGKSLEIEDVVFNIVGVVRNCPLTQVYAGSDIYLPYTADKSPLVEGELAGRYMAIIVARKASDLPRIRADFLAMLPKIPLQNDKDVAKKKLGSFNSSGDGFNPDSLVAHAETYVESFTSILASTNDDSGKATFFMLLSLFALLFMLLPALNLINVNISRIMERASEIGIRKAYGASAGTLSLQFVIENVILTVIGGGIAIGLSSLIILYLNRYGIGPLPTLNLTINWLVVAVALLLCLVFGLMSGAYPAWRMSKLSVVDALKN